MLFKVNDVRSSGFIENGIIGFLCKLEFESFTEIYFNELSSLSGELKDVKSEVI